MVGAENRDGLVDHVFHVGFGLVELFAGDDLLHPSRIEINEITGAAADIGEMLDGQAEAAREQLRSVVGFSVADEIVKLDKLKADGAISEEEYRKIRARLI